LKGVTIATIDPLNIAASFNMLVHTNFNPYGICRNFFFYRYIIYFLIVLLSYYTFKDLNRGSRHVNMIV